MDTRLRELERAAISGDPQAQGLLNAALCRLDGHQFTIFHTFRDYTNEKNHVKVRVCWRCHQPEVFAQVVDERLDIPEYVLWRSKLFNSPIHALLEFKIKRKVIKKARKKRSLRNGHTQDFPEEPPQPTTTRITIKAKTACNQEIDTISDPHHLLRLLHGPGWDRDPRKRQQQVTCSRCLRTSKLSKAREKAGAIYKELYEAARERIWLVADCNDSESQYLPSFDEKH